jgi:hypothetical protein
MTRFTLTLAALAFASAAPAAAQYNGRYDAYAAGDVDIQGLGAEIDAAASRGEMSSQDANELRSQLRGLVNLQRQYAANGLTSSERNDRQQRAQGLRNEIAEAGGSASSYGSPADRTGSGQYGGQYRAGDRGYADSDRGTYGNVRPPVNEGTYGNGYNRHGYTGGAYANPYNSPAYNGGAYGNAYGNRGSATSQYGQYGQYGQYDRNQAYRDDDRYARDDRNRDDRDDGYGDEDGIELRVGDRATGDLYGVPDQYRARFRDTPYVYYRYGAGNVYQIDARSGAVTRVIRIVR